MTIMQTLWKSATWEELLQNGRVQIAPASGAISIVQNGSSVVLDLDGEKYYGMNAVATIAWAQLSKGATFAQVVETVAEEFDIVPETVGRDIAALFAEFCDRGLAQICD